MEIDYKINTIKDDGKKTLIRGTVYEGQHEEVTDVMSGEKKITYVRKSILKKFELELKGNANMKSIRSRCGGELSKHVTESRVPINEQR